MTRRPAGNGTASAGRPDRCRASTDRGQRFLHCAASTTLALCLVLPAFSTVFGSSEKMRGPDAKRHRRMVMPEPETSAPRVALFGMLTLYQRYVSPIDGERCGFAPSCSAFAREAVGRQGAVQGVLATADRLMRCTPFKRPGPDYLLLPNGKLFDPVDYNLLSSP